MADDPVSKNVSGNSVRDKESSTTSKPERSARYRGGPISYQLYNLLIRYLLYKELPTDSVLYFLEPQTQSQSQTGGGSGPLTVTATGIGSGAAAKTALSQGNKSELAFDTGEGNKVAV